VWFEDKQYDEWWRLQAGYHLQHTVRLSKDPCGTRTQDGRGSATSRVWPPSGLCRRANEKASLAWSKYIIVDTHAKAVQSGDAKASIEWGPSNSKGFTGVVSAWLTVGVKSCGPHISWVFRVDKLR